MFNYNFSILKLILQNRNPYSIFGNTILFVKAILKPLETLKIELLEFIITTQQEEKWAFETMAMEKLLNDKYAIGLRTIKIETLPKSKVVPLANELGGLSYLGTEDSHSSWVIPTHEEAVNASGIQYHFIIYADADVIDQFSAEIMNTIELYRFRGLRYQIRSNNDLILTT